MRRIVAAADACRKPGELGALMRREGIYSSMLSTWLTQVALANEVALGRRRRGPRPAPARADRLRIERLEREPLSGTAPAHRAGRSAAAGEPAAYALGC
jgi:hypothetical protein